MPVVYDLAQERHLNVWKYLCAPVLGVYGVIEAQSVATGRCANSNAALMQAIGQGRVRDVLLISYWSQATEGRDILMEGPGKRDPFYGDDQTHSTSPEQARGVFRTHFIETIRTLSAQGVRVWIMKEVPTHTYWVSNQLAKVLLFGGNPDAIGRPFSEIAGRRSFVDSVLGEVAGENVIVLDPVPIFCGESGFCRAAENGRALYSDYNHVSVLGAAKLRPMFEAMFRQLGADARGRRNSGITRLP
jgi:hypothetical protein